MGKNRNDFVFGVKVEAHDQNEVNKSEREHTRLVAESVNIHDGEINILTEPAKVVIRLNFKK